MNARVRVGKHEGEVRGPSPGVPGDILPHAWLERGRATWGPRQLLLCAVVLAALDDLGFLTERSARGRAIGQDARDWFLGREAPCPERGEDAAWFSFQFCAEQLDLDAAAVVAALKRRGWAGRRGERRLVAHWK